MLDIRIAKPCNQTWTAMKGDEEVRHCGACRKNVYNISQMTEKEVEELIRRTEGHFCARIYRRTDGRVLTADCPKGVAAVRRKRTLAVGAAITAFAGVLLPVLRPATMGATRAHARPYATESEPPLTGKVKVSEAVMGTPVWPTPKKEQFHVTMGDIAPSSVELGQISVRTPSKDGHFDAHLQPNEQIQIPLHDEK